MSCIQLFVSNQMFRWSLGGVALLAPFTFYAKEVLSDETIDSNIPSNLKLRYVSVVSSKKNDNNKLTKANSYQIIK